MLYTQAPSTWPTGSKPTLRIAANSSEVRAEPQVPLRRISAIRASAAAGSFSLTMSRLIARRGHLVLRVPFFVSALHRFHRAGGLLLGRILPEPVLARGRTVILFHRVVLEASPPLLSLFAAHPHSTLH